MTTTTRAWVLALLMVVMLAMPMVPASTDDAREDYTVDHVSTFADGKSEKIVTLTGSGTDKAVNIALPNGARVLSATMNLTTLPGSDPISDFVENLTLDVGNDGALEYAFQGKGYGRMGSQTLFTNGLPHLNVSLPQNGGTNATPSVRLPRKAVVSSATLKVSAGGVVGNAGKILLCAAETLSYVQDLQNKLKAFPDVTVCDQIQAQSTTPTLETLKQYDAVLVYSDYTFLDPNTLGNNLADYVDAGGGVIVAVFTHYPSSGLGLGGRFISGGYSVINPANGYSYSSVSMGSVLVPNHPIMNGVNAFSVVFHVSGSSLIGNSQLISTFNDGSTMIATKDINGVKRCDFGFWPTCGDVYSGQWTQKPDGQNLIHNALSYVGRKAINISLDVGNDGNIEYNNSALNTTEATRDVTAQINAYLATAPPNGTDAYGNEYVDVPLAMSSNTSGAIQLNNLSIVYDYSTTVDPNPTNGNLAGSLNALLPTKYDTKTTNIPIAIYSSHAGKLRLSGLSIDFTPPVHPAIISSRTPEDTVVLMDENTTQEFCITARDPYDYPMNTSWTVNGKTVVRNVFGYSHFADYDANGTYNITVTVDNTLQKVATSWQVIVRNVNRKPLIDSFSPEKKFEMDENSSATFEMSASDPDGNPLTITWYLDGKRVLSEESMYEYKTTYASAGKHEVKVTVADNLQGSTTFIWEVTVRDVNAGPVIADSSPPGDTVTMPENSSRKFSVTDISPDLDKQFITWFLDGTNTGITGRSYNYNTDFNSAGNHVVLAQVSDGKLSENRTWTVTVTDVNRPPVALISSPAPKAEFMLGTEISFEGSASTDPDGDALTLSWSEAGKPLGTGNTVSAKLTKGKHTILLSVDDGRKGTATAQVEIYVRYLDFKGTVTVDQLAPVEGQKLIVKAALTNRGDGSVDELSVTFKVDGNDVTTVTIETVEPDAEFPLEFPWTAVKGDHRLDVTVNNQTFTKTIAVAKKPAATGPVSGDMTMILVAMAVIAIVAVAAGALFMLSRRKQAAPPQYDYAYQDQRMEEPYRPIKPQPAPRAPAPVPPPARPAPVPPPVQPAPAPEGEARAREALANLDNIIQEAERAGLDVTKARQSQKVARNFLDMGKYDKALLYCQNAENSIE